MPKPAEKQKSGVGRAKFGGYIGYVWTVIGTFVATAASVVALLSYKSPASFPIVEGVNFGICSDQDFEDSDFKNHERFLKEIETYNRQVIYLKEFGIGMLPCWEIMNKRKITEKEKRGYSSKHFDFIDNTVRFDAKGEPISGALTIGFKKAFVTDPPSFSGLWLTVRAPEKEHHFSDSNCGETCFGANGIYRVTVSASEGVIIYKLDPFPVSAAILDSYQCTLDKVRATTRVERFFACRF